MLAEVINVFKVDINALSDRESASIIVFFVDVSPAAVFYVAVIVGIVGGENSKDDEDEGHDNHNDDAFCFSKMKSSFNLLCFCRFCNIPIKSINFFEKPILKRIPNAPLRTC